MTVCDEAFPDNERGSKLGIVARPPFQLRSLPVRFRWEATRRHPYYLDWSSGARAHHDNEPTQHPAEPLFRQAAVVVLGAIGVSGRPLDPATDFGRYRLSG